MFRNLSTRWAMRTLGALAGTVTAVAALGGLVGALEGSASAAATHHVYRTGGSGLSLRSAPSTSASRVTVMPDGAAVSVSCWASAQNVLGDPLWLHVSYGSNQGWAADYYVDTHWRSPGDLTAAGVPPCSGSSNSQ